MMPLRLSCMWNSVLVTGCCLLLAACAAVQRRISLHGQFPWATEMGSSQFATAQLPPEAAAEGHFFKAEIAMNRGDQAVALNEYELAVKADPGSPLLRQRLAMLYVRANRLQDALEQVQKAVELAPQNVQARALHAGIISALGQDADAVAEYEVVLQLDPNNQEAHLFLGALYGKRGEFDRAVAVLEELTRLSPQSFLGYYYLGRVQAAAHNFDKAESAYKEALRLNPQSEMVLLDMALL
jgi:tetratricopeptide (TPR) repeat protein